MKPAAEALLEIEREYDMRPEGWRFYAGFDKSELPTLYIFHNEYAWTIKFPKYGMNGLAEKVKIEEDELIQSIADDPMSFGLRIVNPCAFMGLMRKIKKKESLSGEQKHALKPVSRKQAMEQRRGCLTGPYMQPITSPIAPISASQVDLEIRLKKELKHLTDGMYH